MLCLYAFTLISLSLAADPEESMTVVETIRHWNYPVETHEVVTRDGYVLSMYRIRQGRSEKKAINSTCSKPPLLLVHGLGADSGEFVLNPPESSPAMILADSGFDVFMINHRGTTYSRKHVRLNPSDEEFWQFTLDEFAKYDAAAAVDKVLELNGAESLFWLGHSQGTVVGFMMLADYPEYNRKVKALFQLAPAGTTHHVRGLGRILPYEYGMIKQLVSFMGPRQFAPRVPGFTNKLARFVCINIFPEEVCNDLMFLIGGPPSPHFNRTRLPVYTSNYPCGTSTWNVLHWAQMCARDSVDHFDFSAERNMKKYGQAKAPAYNYSRITSDVYLFWSRNDWLTPPEEIESFLLRKLKSLKATFEIEEYNHFDFAMATNIANRLYSTIIGLSRKYERC